MEAPKASTGGSGEGVSPYDVHHFMTSAEVNFFTFKGGGAGARPPKYAPDTVSKQAGAFRVHSTFRACFNCKSGRIDHDD